MNTRRLLPLAAALLLTAAACGSDDQPVVPVTGPTLTTVPPIETTRPPDAPAPGPTTTVAGTTSQPPVTAAPLDDPKPGVERFVPVLSLDEGIVSLDVVFVDGSTAHVEWPAALDLVGGGLTPYGWAFVAGGSSRDFFIRPGRVEDVLELLGGADKLTEYPDGAGSSVGLWRPQQDEVDYLGFEFGDWTVLVYDYRSALQMTDDERRLWATSFHGEISEAGFLVLSADYPLRLVHAGQYPTPLNMTMRGADGEVTLTPEVCEPGVIDAIDTGASASWCSDDGNMVIEAYGPSDFQQAVFDGLAVRSVVIAEPPPPPPEDEEDA